MSTTLAASLLITPLGLRRMRMEKDKNRTRIKMDSMRLHKPNANTMTGTFIQKHGVELSSAPHLILSKHSCNIVSVLIGALTLFIIIYDKNLIDNLN
jgi:hypothetical protein